jgi:uncharacterized repeat protein (TIGR01451 family)
MKTGILNRAIGSSILCIVTVWLSAAARGETPLALLQEAFPGVDLSYLQRGPKDYVPIAISSVRTWGNPNGVEVVFTAPVDPVTATNAGNYAITPSITVQRAVIGTNGWTVKLTTTTMADAVLHTLAVSNVQDLSNPPNTISPGSTAPILKAQGVITRKVFTGIGGNWLNSLTNNPKFPNSPDGVDWQTSFEAPTNQADYYGDQMIGYICPPVTGDYQFFIASDNEGRLYLSTDATPANKAVMASVPDATGYRQWSKYTSQASAYVKLEAGRIYYIEGLMAESTGTDWLAVTWRMRGMPAPVDGDAPIPGGFLSSITPSAPAGIITAPQDLTVSERQTASFGVVAGGTPAYTYQWRKNGFAIPGATATNYVIASASYSDNNALFSVIVSNSFSSITSTAARLTVLRDTNAPVIARLSGGPTLDRVLVGFSEPVTPATAVNPRNYTLSGGLTVLGAEPLPDQTNVVLTTSLQTAGQLYSLTVTGVTDTAAAPNAANSISNFTAWVSCRGFARREAFFGISGSAVADLLNTADFPDNPDLADYPAQSEAPQNIGPSCGERLTGLLLPPTTGYYTFYFCSADQGALYLSPDENPAHKVLIATEPQWNYNRNWVGTERRNATSPENRSASIYLQASQRYYFEAVMKDSDGENRVALTWQLPGAPMPSNGDPPIGGAYLACYANPVGPSLVITQQPLPAVAVLESALTNFTVGVTSSYAPVFYQWQKSGADIAGANSSTYTTPRLLRTDSGAAFRCLVSIPGLCLTSSVAVLTVTPDNTPPQAFSAATLAGSTNVGLCFNELMDPVSATNPANYSLSIGGAVTSATLRSDGQSVSLSVSALGFTNYTVRLNNLKDYAGNPLPANTAVPVTVIGMENTDVGIAGDPVEIGSTYSCSASNFDVVAGGSDIWNNRDGFHFIYQPRDGGFDARVRIARLDATSYWSFAGLHVRESLYSGSREMKIVVANPAGANGYHVGYRPATDGGSANWPGYGSIASPGAPVPNAWIRLTRTNDLFTAWRGTNGVDWTAFAQMTMSFTGRVYVGLAACPVNNNVGQATTAWFRDFSISPDYPLPAPLDLTIKKASDPGTAFALNDVYQVTPAGAQVLVQSANPTNAASFMVKVQNDGVVTQSLVLRAIESADAGWTTTYLWSGSNITTLITNTTGFALSNLPPGSAEFVQVDLLPGSRLAGAATKSTTIRVATDLYTRSQRDAVQAAAISEVSYQPDMLVRRLTDVVYAGSGIYNSTGSNQTKSVTADTGTLVVYPLTLVNAGNLTNAFTVVGSPGGGGWSVRYFDALVGGSDITAEVAGGGAGLSLLPGASWEFRAEVTASLAVLPGASNILYVTGRSAANPARTDTVKMVTLAQITTNVPQRGVFTADADFERGTQVGTVYGDNQLTLSAESVTWPFIWVPNSNEGTVSKVDVRTGAEVGRYRTCPPGVNGQPSRTTIDQYGNCWVANRQSGTVVKIGLLESGQFIDRNTNGVPDTSYDANGDGDISSSEMLPWGQDECVLYEVILIPGKEGTYTPGTYTNGYVDNYWNPGPRGIAVDYSGNVWAGTHDAEKYYYLDGSTARILRTNDLSSVDHTPYGAVIDANGILWSSGYRESGTPNVLRLNPADNSLWVTNTSFHPYGLGLDHNNHLFVSGYQESKLSRLNVLTTNIEWTVNAGYQSRGVAATDDGDVWVACSSEGNVWRFSNDGVFKGKITVGATPTGVSVDSAGKVWVVNDGDEYIKRIDPAIGAFGAIDLSKRIIGGLHYGYSDMTGIIVRSTTGHFGTWTVIHDAIVHFTQWGVISWNGYQPSGNNIGVRVRSSDDGVIWANWETATNGVPLGATPPGRFLQVEVSLRSLPSDPAPVLFDLTVQPLPQRSADLAITQVVVPSPATNEHFITWTISATNQGPQDARGVYVTDTLPAGVTVVSITNSSGSLAQLYGGLRWVIGNLNAGSNFTMTVTALVTNAGILTNSAAVAHYEVDPAPANNQSVSTTVALPNPCLAPPADLVGWWPGDGNANDLTGNHPGTAVGNLGFLPGKVGQAFQFDGVDASVDLGTWFNFQVFTVVMWVKAGPSQVAYADIIDNNHTGSRSWVVQHSNTSDATRSYFDWDVQGIGGTNFGLLKGVWQHLALCLDSNGVGRVYLDGALVGTFGGSGSVIYDGSQFLRLGCWGGGGRNFNGQLDEVAVFNRALSAAEIFALYDAGASGTCKTAFAPSVQIGAGAGPSVNVSWPVAATGFQLFSADRLSGPWVQWPGTPTLVGDQLVFNISATGSARYFRLKKL